jgi:orotidine-5'-phosphate decarboxylase
VKKSILAKDRLIFALDVPNREEAEKYARLLGDAVGCFKIGLELFIKEGPDVIKLIKQNSSASIFLDLKLYDIPATVRSALRSAANHGVRFITIHGSGGKSVLQTASEVRSLGLEVLAVTVLTSVSESELGCLGFKENLSLNQLVLDRAAEAQKYGCSGVICSGKEVSLIRRTCNSNFKLVVPGIRPTWAKVSKDDQSRIVTPKDAIHNGADLIVVGRPIRDAKEPFVAARKIVDEIESAIIP